MIDELLAGASSTRRRRERRGQILGHGEVQKHLVALGHQNDAQARDLVGRPVPDPPSLEGHAAVGDAGVVEAEEAGNRPQGRGLAGAVGAENGDDLPRLGGEADPCTAVIVR
jgi:hypothetical protein